MVNSKREEAELSSLAAALEAYGIFEVDDSSTSTVGGLPGWWYVGDGDGTVSAYFSTETAARRWRLSEINRRLNG